MPHTQWHKSIGNPIRSMTLVVKSSTDPMGSLGVPSARRFARSIRTCRLPTSGR